MMFFPILSFNNYHTFCRQDSPLVVVNILNSNSHFAYDTVIRRAYVRPIKNYVKYNNIIKRITHIICMTYPCNVFKFE